MAMAKNSGFRYASRANITMEKPGLITTIIGIMIDSWAGMFRVIRLG